MTQDNEEPSAASDCSVANHDAVPAARAVSDEARTDKAATSHRRDRSGNTPVAESATPDGYAYTGWPYPKGKAASISDAEIDALEFVVERGRIASQMDYGVLRSLLVRLRPEWLDRPEPVKDCDSDRPKPIAHTPPTHTTPGQCSTPRECTEPVAFAVVFDSTEQIDCEFIYPDEATAGDVALDSNGSVVPLYRSPTLTDAEREALWFAIAYAQNAGHECEATMRGLLKRLK